MGIRPKEQAPIVLNFNRPLAVVTYGDAVANGTPFSETIRLYDPFNLLNPNGVSSTGPNLHRNLARGVDLYRQNLARVICVGPGQKPVTIWQHRKAGEEISFPDGQRLIGQIRVEAYPHRELIDCILDCRHLFEGWGIPFQSTVPHQLSSAA